MKYSYFTIVRKYNFVQVLSNGLYKGTYTTINEAKEAIDNKEIELLNKTPYHVSLTDLVQNECLR